MLIGGKLTAVLIGAVAGALFATLFGVFKDLMDRRRRRRTLATVLLCELRSADQSLRSLYESPDGTFPTKAFEVFELENSLLELFEPDTARLILDFTTKLSGIRNLLDSASNPKSQKTTQQNTILLAYIAAAVGLVPELKEALEEEGGEYIPFVAPDMPELSEDESIPPALNDSPFPDIMRNN